MIMQTPGKIFLADQRLLWQDEAVQCYSTFNYSNFLVPHKHPFGKIYALDDYMLQGGASQVIQADSGFYMILLPVYGAIYYSDASIKDAIIAAGQAHIMIVKKGATIEIRNPFRKETVNFLKILIKAPGNCAEKILFQSTYDEINKNRNKMIPVFPVTPKQSSVPFSIYIGQFNGRGETTHTLKQHKGFFGLVLEGAFEVQGRLLHARDGLALWNLHEAEIEALSNNAIFLIIETEMTGK